MIWQQKGKLYTHIHIQTHKCGRSADGTTTAIKNHYTNKNNNTNKANERNKKLSKGFLLIFYVVVNWPTLHQQIVGDYNSSNALQQCAAAPTHHSSIWVVCSWSFAIAPPLLGHRLAVGSRPSTDAASVLLIALQQVQLCWCQPLLCVWQCGDASVLSL